jgi:hypothetical protein
MSRSLLLSALLVTAQVSGGGCSYMFVTGPPPPEKRTHPLTCSSNSVAPVVDIMLIGVQAAGFLKAASDSDAEYERDTGVSKGAGAVLSLGLGVLFLSSAITGVSRMKACTAAKTAEVTDAEARVAAAAAKAAGEAAAAASGSAASTPAAQPVAPAPAAP